jgi:hypothetical protein
MGGIVMTPGKKTLLPLIAGSIVLLFMSGCSNKISPGTTLVGEAVQEPAGVDGARYPMIMHIDTYDGYGVSGTLHWPTLRDSRTRFRGTFNSDNEWEFVEYELLQGSGIVLPAHFKAKLTGETMIGTCRAQDRGVTITMSFALKIK